MMFVLLLSAGLHAQTSTLPTNPPLPTPPREQVCAELFSDPPKRICADKATTANPDTRIAKLEVDLAIVVETLELQLKAIHALLAKIEALEATNNVKLEAHRKSSSRFLNAYTVAALPNNVRIGTEVVVTDSWLGGCAIGNGTKHVICVRTADGWEKKLPTFAELTARVETVENLGKWRGWTIADIVKRLEKLEEKKK